MIRIAIVSGITLFSFAAANAGQIQIGGVNGLTSSVVTAVGGAAEAGFLPVLFENANITAPTAAPGTFVDGAGDGGSGVTFSKINDTGNFWDLPSGSAGAMVTIPIGLFGVTDVWTMINDIEATGTRDVNVIFNFGTTPTVASIPAVSVHLNDADAASSSGQVRNAVVCNTTCAESSQVGLTGGTFVGVNVVADNVFSSPFFCITQNPLANSAQIGSNASVGCSNGTVYLDDQGFFFNSLNLGSGLTNLNTYLVSVQVKEIVINGSGGSGLTAVTVDQASATPEPSTVLLFVAGLGVVGLGRLRKRA